MLGFLRHSVREFGQTVIMVTHDPVAASYADRVVFLADGQVAGELTRPIVAQLLDALKGTGMLTVTLAGLRARWRRLLLSAPAVALGVAFVAGTLINTATVHASYYSQFAAQARNVDAAIEPANGAQLPLSDLAAVRAVNGAARSRRQDAGPLPIVGANGRASSAIAEDLPADPRFRDYTVLSGGGSVLLDADTAALNHVSAGTEVTVIDKNGRTRRLEVTGIVDRASRAGAAADRC